MKNQDKIYDPTEEQNTQYNSVTCSISRSEDGLKITSIENDITCSWFFERDSTGLLNEEGQKFINNYPGNGNEVVITIKESKTHEQENFVSDCGNWKMVPNFN